MRLPDWEDRLGAEIAAASARPYKPGRHDCILFAAAAVKAVTGKDFARGHRGKYSTLRGAYRYLKRIGFDTPEALIDHHLVTKPLGYAGRGDIVLCDLSAIEDPELSPLGPVPAVCMGAFALCLAAENPASGGTEGMIRVPRALWTKAWEVGEHHSGLMGRRPKRGRRE